MATREPYTIFITSFLAVSLRCVGAFVSRREARALLARSGRHIEIFLPFYVRLGERGGAQHVAVRQFRLLRRMYGLEDLRVVHAGYPGRRMVLPRFFMNLADPRRRTHTVTRIRRELRVLRHLREELGMSRRVIYVLHCGRREPGVPVEESLRACVATLRDVIHEADRAGVTLSLENVYSRGSEEHLGTNLGDIGRILEDIGAGWVRAGVLGWAFDPAHALLAYRGDYDAIERDLRPLLPACIHVHVNHPRAVPARSNMREFVSQWECGDDTHRAPVCIPHRTRYWALLRTVFLESRIPEWRMVTYEVNWAVPVLRGLFGGSPLPEVSIGLDALNRFCNHLTEAFDVAAIERYIDEQLEGEKGRTGQLAQW